MARHSMLVVLALSFTFAGAAPRVFALSVPGIGKDKDKDKKKEKKDEKKDESKGETKSADGGATPPAGEQKTETAPPKEEAAPAAGAVSSSEMTITKEHWDTIKAYKPGTFVEYGMPAQPGMKMRYEVTEVGDNFVTILSTTGMQAYMQKGKIKYIYKGETAEKVSAANKEFNTTRTDMSTDGKLNMRTWTSKEIPQLMGGTVKTDDGQGNVSMILTDFATK